MKREVVVISGVRTPLGKMGGALAGLNAVDLGMMAVRELLATSPVSTKQLDEVIIGNVIQPSDAANISRVIALSAHIPRHVPAYTVHRNCASGMQAVTDAAEKILSGRADVMLAGGVESMTHAPLLVQAKMQQSLTTLSRVKTIPDRLKALYHIARSPWQPRSALLEGLTDSTVHLNMGQTAELLAREFSISRREQDQFALNSHQRAAKAWEEGWFNDEVMRLYPPPACQPIWQDEGIRKEQSLEALAKLKPVFDRPLGSVTAGNSSQLTDGATMLLLSSREKAEAEGWPILGYLHDWAYAGCDPERMGLGPVYAMHKLLSARGMGIKDIESFEINEAFAVQVLAVLKAMGSKHFAESRLQSSSPLGAPDMDKINQHGGAIAVGHPVGMTGARLILTLLRQLKYKKGGGLGIASLCIGGGQGGAVLLGGEPCRTSH